METFFDWGLFLPAKWPHQLLLTGINDTGDLSALFIWVIIATFVLVSVWLVIRGTRAFSSIRFLNGIAEAASSENLAMQRRDLRNLAAKRDYEGQLWKSFDASWVESADGGARICQTLDSAHFFNTATLAKGISENRLVAAIPGILTAFGILGTFVGLQIGLSSLDLSSPQVLTQSIVPLIKGAAVAFSTSVWGTAASVIFNFLEKSIEQAIGRRINHLQNRIDNLFVRHLSEQTLINIERANVEAENALKGLAEQIGERLQEVMHEVPKQIQAGIEASITPAVEKLVEAAETLAAKQGDSAQEGLSALIENFMQGVARSGEESGKRLESASAQLGSSIAAWSEGMDGFLNRLDHRAGEFDTQISGMLEQGRDLRAEAAISQKFLANVAGEMKSGGELLKQATRDLQKFGEDVNQAANLLGEAQTQAAKLTEASARKQQESSQLLSQIAHSLDQANDGLLVSSQSLKDSAEMATASFGNMIATQQEFLEGLKKTLTALRKQTGQMMNDYATDVEEQTKARMQQWNAQTQEFSKGMVAAVNAMSEILGEIDNALAQRQK